MNQKDRTTLENKNVPAGDRKNWQGLISLIGATTIIAAIGGSALTIVVLKRFNLLANNNSSNPAPSATTTLESPTPTVSPIVIESPSAIATPSITDSPVTTLPSSLVNLLNMDCQSATPGWRVEDILKSVKVSESIGGEVLPVQVEIGGYYGWIEANRPLEAVCNLKDSFTELRLVYGINSANGNALIENKLLFRIELDNKPVEIKEVVVGQKYTSNVKLQGSKNVKLRVECTNPIKRCPSLSFSEMSLI